MSSKPQNEIDLGKYRREVAENVMQEIFIILQSHQQEFGKKFSHELAMTLLSSMVSTLSFNHLVDTAKSVDALPPKEKFNTFSDLWMQMKSHIEAAVGTGVESGFQAFDPSGRPEYQVDITLLDDGRTEGKTN